MAIIWAEQALLPDGWARDVRIEIAGGRVAAVVAGAPPEGERVGALLPAPVNLHSHSFQRAMAGMTETRGPDPRDTFWTWRRLMFRFLDHLTPDDLQSIAAFAQMEMLEAGFGAVCEFHYLHHQPGGAPYADLAEMAGRIVAAAAQTGIGLTLLPVLYEHGGCDGRALGPGQVRFGNDPDRFAGLHAVCARGLAHGALDTRIGVAPHSLRAASRDGLRAAVALAGDGPLHMHLAEQEAEVAEVQAAYGARPVEWLLGEHAVGPRWCLIHCTQMEPAETLALAGTGAVAGLCPITEASLGDGIFDGVRFVSAGGRFGVGSDSNIRIDLSGELRGLEMSQRLRDRGRAMLAREAGRSTGRVLFQGAAQGGAAAAGRGSGTIAAGEWADLLALDTTAVDLAGCAADALLDGWIFAGSGHRVAAVWAAGRPVVRGGQHIARDAITLRYRATMTALKARL